jgi:hypothetical protein
MSCFDILNNLVWTENETRERMSIDEKRRYLMLSFQTSRLKLEHLSICTSSPTRQWTMQRCIFFQSKVILYSMVMKLQVKHEAQQINAQRMSVTKTEPLRGLLPRAEMVLLLAVTGTGCPKFLIRSLRAES